MSSEKEKLEGEHHVHSSDTESLGGPNADPLHGEHQLVRQLKNRHIAMIRSVILCICAAE